jgi:hypothetical protein
MKVVRLSDLRTDRLYPIIASPGTHSYYKLRRSQGHIVVGRIMRCWLQERICTVDLFTLLLKNCSNSSLTF